MYLCNPLMLIISFTFYDLFIELTYSSLNVGVIVKNHK